MINSHTIIENSSYANLTKESRQSKQGSNISYYSSKSTSFTKAMLHQKAREIHNTFVFKAMYVAFFGFKNSVVD